MIFPDINILLYAHNKDFEHQAICADWLNAAMNGGEQVAFSWHTLLGFFRISTSPRIFPGHFSAKEALQIVADLLDSPNSVVIGPTERHFTILRDLVLKSGISGARTSDAHLAALAIEHGAKLVSTDRDFRSFDGLQLIDPLKS